MATALAWKDAFTLDHEVAACVSAAGDTIRNTKAPGFDWFELNLGEAGWPFEVGTGGADQEGWGAVRMMQVRIRADMGFDGATHTARHRDPAQKGTVSEVRASQMHCEHILRGTIVAISGGRRSKGLSFWIGIAGFSPLLGSTGTGAAWAGASWARQR